MSRHVGQFFFKALILRDVAVDANQSVRLSSIVGHQRNNDVDPESCSVLALSSQLTPPRSGLNRVVYSLFFCLPLFGINDEGDMLALSLLGGIAIQFLRPVAPVDQIAFQICSHHRLPDAVQQPGLKMELLKRLLEIPLQRFQFGDLPVGVSQLIDELFSCFALGFHAVAPEWHK